jgi:NTE family protein
MGLRNSLSCSWLRPRVSYPCLHDGVAAIVVLSTADGGYRYLLYNYRQHKFDSLLRKYLGRARKEQLILPIFTVSVDLVEGEPLVCGTGDATIGILDSINLPPLALPILNSGQAFVDGGLLNNVPADVLLAKGCNLVIASTVTAKLEKDFGHSRRRWFGGRRVSTIKVIMRQNMIQRRKMNAVGSGPADFVIAPDVSSLIYRNSPWLMRWHALGEATTVANLLKMLSKLDAKLFQSATDVPSCDAA